MKILVCVKQVCESTETLGINETATWIEYAGNTVFRMNRYDEYALEEGLRIAEHYPNAAVDVLSVGPERVQATIRRALGMGAHHGIHIMKNEDGYINAFERASLISAAVRSRNYDLILTGVMAEDDMEGQVGGLTAAMLSYACATNVIFQGPAERSGELAVEREIEGGCRERLTLKFPAVLTIQSGTNTPRYPTLSHILKSRTAALERIDACTLGAPRSSQVLEKIAFSPRGGKGEIIEGSPAQKAEKLLEILHRHSLL